MEKNIRDYLPFYIGCKIQFFSELDNKYHISGMGIGSLFWAITESKDIKLLLRPLDTMTEDEADEYGVESDGGEFSYGTISSDCTVGGFHHILSVTRIAEITRQLCKARFDCFDLIPEGLALDATKEVNHG